MTLIYEDPRFGDRYEIEVDELFNFDSALRFMDGQIVDPIYYDRLTDISPVQRATIENLIRARQRYNLPK